MSKMKKIVLFIVEGPTDKNAIGSILSKYYNSEKVRFCVVHGDITTVKTSNSNNIVSQIDACVKTTINKYFLKRRDILKIVHISGK